jgi:hypothetical protein
MSKIHCTLCQKPIETIEEFEQVTLGGMWKYMPDAPSLTPEQKAECPSVLTCELINFHTACLRWRINHPKQEYGAKAASDETL